MLELQVSSLVSLFVLYENKLCAIYVSDIVPRSSMPLFLVFENKFMFQFILNSWALASIIENIGFKVKCFDVLVHSK